MKKILTFLFLLIVLCQTGTGFSANLGELEKRIELSEEGQLLGTEISMEMAAREKAKADSGLKISGQAGYGWNHEPVSLTSSDMIYYESLFGRLALILPVLGSRWQEQTDILKTERSLLEKKYHYEIFKKTSLSSLRKMYADYWVSEKKIKLAQAFLRDEAAINAILQKRTKQGLILKADNLEFMTAFGLARREIASSKLDRKRASERIDNLTGINLDKNQIANPDLPFPEMDEVIFQQHISMYNPDVEILKKIVSENEKILKETNWSGIKSNVSLAYSPEKDTPGKFGNGAVISINFTAPLDIVSSNRAAEKMAKLEIRKSRISLQNVEKQVVSNFLEFSLTYQNALANLSFDDQRLAAAFESLREARLRLSHFQGDVFEKFLQARLNYFRRAIDALDGVASTFKTCSDLLLVAEKKSQIAESRTFTLDNLPGFELRKRYISPTLLFFNPGIVKTRISISSKPSLKNEKGGFGVYIWNSHQILGKDNDLFWKRLKNDGIDKILVSFDGHQIEQIREGNLGASVAKLIENAKKNEIKAILLLGEPSWILPGKRKDLLNILHLFKSFKFEGLHLDIEPDQLNPAVGKNKKEMTEYLLDTLKEVLLRNSWPLGISIHPRYFNERETGVCLGCELEKLHLAEVALMIYSSDTRLVLRKAEEILRRYPLLSFSVSQSFESTLPKNESYFSKGRTTFLEDMEKLQASIPDSNFNSILIQSWEEMRKTYQR